MASYTTPDELDVAYSTIQKTFKSGKTKSIAWRKWQLKQLWWMVSDNESAILKALHTDLNRHDFESFFFDIGGTKRDILDHLQHIDQWTADEIPDAGFLFGTLGGARIRKEPLGLALIIGTWNFPIVVVLSPLIAAISAGCCAILKPSEITQASQNLLAEIVPRYLDQDAIRVVTGGPKETSLILERRFDHIFYTGSPNVAKIVQAAAAKNLTPTTLELGGQAPVIVAASADIDLAAKRVVYSKFLNAGQICLAGNHVFIAPSVHDEFVERASFWIGEFMKDDGKGQAVRIVNERNYDRLIGLLNQTGGNIVYGGNKNRDDKYIQPTVVTNVTMQDSLLSEEIFGPLLPIVKASPNEACEIIQRMEHPLGLYIFSKEQKEIDEILSKTASGGVTINDLMAHAGVPNAPFGGVGNSGNGAYHGRYGFEAFTHNRTVVYIPGWFEYLLSFRYPPYHSKHIAKISVNKPDFKRGETMEDQRVGTGLSDKLLKVLGTSSKWVGLAVLLAMVDARFGGKPRLLELLRSGMGGLGSRLPV